MRPILLSGWVPYVVTLLLVTGCFKSPETGVQSRVEDHAVVELRAAEYLLELYPTSRIGLQEPGASLGGPDAPPGKRSQSQVAALLSTLKANLVETPDCTDVQSPDCVSVLVRIGAPEVSGDSARIAVSARSYPPNFVVEALLLYVREGGGWALKRRISGRHATVAPRPPE